MTQKPPYLVDGSLSDEDNVLPIAPQDPGRTADALRLMDQIIQRSPIGVAVIDHEGVFRSVNPSYCLIYGYRRMGSTHFLIKTIGRVSTEMSLHVLAYNLKRVMRVLGIAETMKAMRLTGV